MLKLRMMEQASYPPVVQAPINKPSNTKVSFIATVSSSFIWFILTLLLISILDTYFSSRIRFTSSVSIVSDFSQTLEALQLFWMWLLGIFIASTIITYFISKSSIFSKLFLGFICIAAVGLSMLAYWVSRQPCEDMGCVVILLSLWFAEGSWLIAAATLPTLFIATIKKQNVSLSNKTFWLIGASTLIAISLLWFFTTFHSR